MQQATWAVQVASKLERAKLSFGPLPPDRPEVFATRLTRLEDPWAIYPVLSPEDVVWISAFSTDYSEGKFFREAYLQQNGFDSRLFKRALSYANSGLGRFDPTYARLVVVNYNLLLNAVTPNQPQIRPYVSVNQLTPITEDQLTRYDVRWLMVREEQRSGYPEEMWGCRTDPARLELYLDAPLGFAITYKNLDNAMSSFWAENADTLMIYQLQGVRRKKFRSALPTGRHHSVGLNLIDFRKTLVDFISELARNAGFARLAIQGARNNMWAINQDDDGRIHLPLEKAHEVYDGTANRLGFTQNRNGNWYIEL